MRRGLVFALLVACAAALSACGGGERQDANEPEGEFALAVVKAQFPRAQSIAKRSTLAIEVRNTGSRRAPNVAVTVETQPPEGKAPVAFGQARPETDLADPNRPVWIVDRGPVGGDTAYTNTWALGALDPGQSKTFEWHVTAVQPGRYTVNYRVAPGLDGKAKLAAGSKASGSFPVSISAEPADARVGENGEVIRLAPGSDDAGD